MKPAALAAAVVALLGIIAGYVVLVVTDHDPAGLVQTAILLAGVLGLGAHVERRTQEQNAVISKIDRQTNGVLDKRIREGAREAVTDVLKEHRLIPPPAD